jgi:chromosomal replication initiation ATPase DnaA
MKSDIFNQYAERVCEQFAITTQDLFSKNKRRDFVDARYLLYYLCYKRPMNISYIERFMCDSGYNIRHSSIIAGINIVKKKVEEDADYSQIVKDIQKAVFI